MIQHQATEVYICPQCNTAFSRDEDLKKHLEDNHLNLEPAENVEFEAQIVPRISKVMSMQNITKDHRFQSKGIIPKGNKIREHVCGECEYTTSVKGSLVAHV